MDLSLKLDFFNKRNLVAFNWLFIPYNEILYYIHTVQDAGMELLRQSISGKIMQPKLMILCRHIVKFNRGGKPAIGQLLRGSLL